MSDSWPEADELFALYARLRGGDSLAQSDFLAAVLDPLVAHLRRWRRGTDEHACITAAEDAVLALIHEPAIYDPARRGLIGFLRMSAERDLLNALEKEARHHDNRIGSEFVELAPDRRNTDTEDAADELPSLDDPRVATEIASFTATERAVWGLMVARERSTAAYVPLLGLEHAPLDEQRREVKRAKERITKRLQRAGRDV